MEILSELNENFDLALALGYFDGVHKGHKAVIGSAVNHAKNQNKKSAVITFKDHPCCYFWDVAPKYILTRAERRKKIAELGVDYLYELSFESLSKYTAYEYLKDILIKYFKPISISTGFNHYFGANKSGDTEFLKQSVYTYGYKYFMLAPEQYDNIVISSTEIRKCLAEGNLVQANAMLGYHFPVTGTVCEGKQLGRMIGFRTANIQYPSELIELPFGAYLTKVTVNSKNYFGVTNFGIRPTVSDTKFSTLETHILDFDEDIYGMNIQVEFIERIRAERKFSSLEELKAQISKDIEYVRSKV